MVMLAKIFVALTALVVIVSSFVGIVITAPWYVILWLGIFMVAVVYMTVHGE
jgi:NADH:ubiquinone oxidoreductase subunit 6 (subunit J)